MKTSTQFDQFYLERLKQKIEELEARRLVITTKYSFKKYGRTLLRLLAFAVVLIICSNVFPQVPAQVVFIIPALVLYAIAAPIYILVKRTKAFSPIKTEYKETIVKSIVGFVHKDFLYQPTEGILLEDFSMSGLFEKPSAYRAEDLVTGNANDIQLKISDVNATRRTSSRGNNKSTTVTVFAGLFGVTTLPRRVAGRTLIQSSILANKAMEGALQSFIGQKIVNLIDQKMRSNTIKTGDEEFDKYFSVRYEGDHQGGQLNPVLIQTLIALRREIEIPIYLSMIESKAYFGFGGINLFEVDAHSSIMKNDISKKYFQYLNLALGLSKALHAIVEQSEAKKE
jgi:Protein of unknown function (DUF3137)